MAAPNLTSSTLTTYGRTTATTISTAVTVLISNPFGSNKSYKVNSLYIANIDNLKDARTSVDFFRTSTSYRMIDRMKISSGDSLVAVSRDTAIHLEEGDSLRCYADENELIHVVLGYEIISNT